MAADGCPVKELCEETTCPICLEYFKDPVILDCGHNFCRACLTLHWRGFGMAASCPQCREKDQRRSVRPNRQLANVVDLVKKLQQGERAEGRWRMCEKHQEPLKLYCEEDQALICVVCDRSKEHRAHTVLPMEEASQEHKANGSKAGARSLAVQYLAMEMPKLMEHCQQKGLRSEGLSVEDLRVLLIQHAGQPEPEAAKLKAETIRCRQLAQDAPKEGEPKEMEQLQTQEKIHQEQQQQLTAQAKQPKNEWELPQLRKNQPDKNTPKAFTPFFPGGSPTAFLSTFERAAQRQNVSVDEYMIYLPTLVRGELAKLYHSMPEKGSMTYPVFKEAVLKYLGPDHFGKEFYALQPQEGKSFLEFGVKLEEVLNKWLDSAKADSREKVLDVIVLEQFFFQLPPKIRHLVKTKAPKDVFQAAGIADQLMLTWEGSEKRTRNSRRDGKGSQKGGWEKAQLKREKGSLSVQHQRAPNLAGSEKVCYNYRETGHLKTSCPKLTASDSKPVYYVTAFCEVGKEATAGLREAVMLKDQRVVGVVSTGSDVSIVCADLVSPSDIVPGETFLIQFITGMRTVQVACLPIEWRGLTSLLKVGVVEGLLVPMIIGRDVLCCSSQAFVITPSQWAEKEGAHTDAESQPKSMSVAEQISSGRPAGTSVDSNKGRHWALREILEKVEPPAEGDWPSRSSREEDNLALENGELRRQWGGLRVVPDVGGGAGVDPEELEVGSLVEMENSCQRASCTYFGRWGCS